MVLTSNTFSARGEMPIDRWGEKVGVVRLGGPSEL